METSQQDSGELARLDALAALDLMDTESEERFDRLCRIASTLLKAPIAYIALLDDKRQWFKAQCGLGDLTETPRQGSFCDFALKKDQPTIILDAAVHPNFCDSPYVIGAPFVRLYIGHPLYVEGHHPVGTLCVLDTEARDNLGEEQLAQLGDLARIAESELQLRESLAAQALLIKQRQELEKRSAFVRRVLGRYVTDEVAEHVLAAPEELHLGGQRREVSILMSDLRGFTVMSDRLPPETVVTILNHYLHHMVEIVLKWGGTVDEIIGDALLLIFGAPLEMEDHAQRAASCALEMQLAMEKLNQQLCQEGLPKLACGIGLNTGEVVVGNIGSEKRMKYSVVGSPVNLTARIESFTVGGQILASQTTREALGEAVRLDGKLRVKMKGYENPITIYEIGGLGSIQLTDS